MAVVVVHNYTCTGNQLCSAAVWVVMRVIEYRY
jgi:hypothetical protein